MLALLAMSGFVTDALGRPPRPIQEFSTSEVDVDAVGDVEGGLPASRRVLQDTLWIANWTFDTGMPCSKEGWTHADGYVLNDGAIHWHFETGFATTTGM